MTAPPLKVRLPIPRNLVGLYSLVATCEANEVNPTTS
jgi:hypothetical protein